MNYNKIYSYIETNIPDYHSSQLIAELNDHDKFLEDWPKDRIVLASRNEILLTILNEILWPASNPSYLKATPSDPIQCDVMPYMFQRTGYTNGIQI